MLRVGADWAEYADLVSGKDTLRRSDFVRMVADSEAGLFEVLLCYDTSRVARNVGTAYEYRERLARAGVAIVSRTAVHWCDGS